MPNTPCRYQEGAPGSLVLIEAVAKYPVAVPVLVLDAVIVARPLALLPLPLEGGGLGRGVRNG